MRYMLVFEILMLSSFSDIKKLLVSLYIFFISNGLHTFVVNCEVVYGYFSAQL